MAFPNATLGDALSRFLRNELCKIPEDLDELYAREEESMNEWFSIMQHDGEQLDGFLSTLSTLQLSATWTLWPLVHRVGPTSTLHQAVTLIVEIYPEFMHVALVDLLEMEFELSVRKDTPSFIWKLRSLRKRCYEYAFCHDLTSLILPAAFFTATWQDEQPPSVSQQPIFDTEGPITLPAVLCKKAGGGRLPFFGSCEWLPILGREEQMPFWLWDRQLKRTVESRELFKEIGECPEYVAISHTWGRWKKNKPWLQVPGVKWKLPQNSRFDVEAIPKLLSNVPHPARYIWFDLVCICQVPFDETDFAMMTDVLDPALVEISRREIARQAGIFKQASTVFAWLNDIQSWDGLRAATQWLCCKYFRSQEASGPELALLTPTAESAVPELVQWDIEKNKYVVHSYFTSLWTLQETSLRPDLVICNSSWQPLRLDKSGPATLSHLIALNSAVLAIASEITPPGTDEPPPTGAILLLNFLGEIRFGTPATVSRMSLLTLGNSRQCSENRAEAIMSVVGCTQWYEPLINDKIRRDSEQLVLDKYPMAFITEVRQKLGSAAFFSCHSFDMPFLAGGRKIGDVTPAELQTAARPCGSILPFGPGSGRSPFPLADRADEDHPTLSGWEIQQDGSVLIRTCAVTASTTQVIKGGDRHASYVLAFDAMGDVDLDAWMESFYPAHGPTWAVCLISNEVNVIGLILKEIIPKTMVKVGLYAIPQLNNPDCIPAQMDVDWRVL